MQVVVCLCFFTKTPTKTDAMMHAVGKEGKGKMDNQPLHKKWMRNFNISDQFYCETIEHYYIQFYQLINRGLK